MPIRTLVVDDEPDYALTFGKLLERMFGCEVRLCHTGSEAIDTVKQSRPALAFVDLQLPDMGGDVVARVLNSSDVRPALMVALTGFGGPKYEQLCKDAGFDVFELKPLSLLRAGELVAIAAQLAEASGMR